MESWRHWDDFIKIMSRDYRLTEAETESFLLQFTRQNIGKSQNELSEQLPLMENPLATHKKRMSEVYDKFSQSYPELKSIQHKSKALQKWLEAQYSQWLPVQDSDSASSPATTETPIDWRDICNKVLATQQLRRQATAQQYELNIYVPLGLMERPKLPPNPRPEPTGEESQPQKEPELQIVQTYKDDAFFQKVIAENRTENRKHIAIIGEPGAGKTTLLGELAERLIDLSPNPSPARRGENDSNSYSPFPGREGGWGVRFPICIRLADLRDSTIADYLLNNWLSKALQFIDYEAENVTPEIGKALKQLFAEGKVWLLLDGVDEMAATSPIEALARIREQLTDWVGKARVVLTCRLNVWDAAICNTLTNFDTYKTLEFEPDDVDEFIRQWFEEASQDEKRRNSGNETFWREQGKRLQQQLKAPGKERIRELVRNPLRLSMLCQSWCVPEQDLPETKAALYEQFTTYFFEWKQEEFQKKHRVLKEKDKKQIQQALAKLALAAMESANRFRIEQEFAIKQMGEEWFDLADELGWLVLVDRDTRTKKPVYAFFHPTFQEYFAACAIDDWHFFLNHQIPPVSSECYRIFELQWREVILLWLGREDVESDQKEEFIKALVEFDDGCKKFYRYRAYFLAAVGIAEFKKCSIATKIVKQIVKFGFGDFNEEKQVWVPYLEPIVEGARAALLQTKSEIAIEQLTDLLATNEDENTRGTAATILGRLDPGNSDAIAAVVGILTNTQYLYTGWITAHILGEIGTGNPDAIAALLHVLETNTEDNIRRAAAYSLGKIAQGNYYAIERSLELLKSNKNQDILRKCAYILGEIAQENPNAKKALVKLLDSTESDDIRWRSADILGTLYPGNTESKQALVKLLDSTKHDFIRWRSADILGTLYPGNPEAKEELVQILKTTEYWDIRWQAAESLGKIDPGNPDAIDALVELLKTTENRLFSKIPADSLAEIAQENPQARAASFLIMHGFKASNIPSIAADILGEIAQGNIHVIAALVEILKNNNHYDIHSIVADTLGKIAQGNSEAIAALCGIIDTTKYLDIRIRAAENLGKIDPVNDRAIKALVEIIGNPESGDLRITATGSLQKIDPGNTDAKDILVKLLKTTEDSDLCIIAAESLGKIDPGNPLAIKAVEKLLENTEDDIRLITADNLETIDSGNTQAMALVRHWYVADKLEKIDPGNAKAINALVGLLEKTDDENIRFRVANSLREIGKGNPDAIAPLFRLLATTKYEKIRKIATYKLG
jgi:HEAT repeat protein